MSAVQQATGQRVLVAAGALLILVLVGFLLHTLASILQPLFIALVLVYLIRPAMRFMTAWRVPDVLALPVLFAVVLCCAVLFGVIIQKHVAQFQAKEWLYRQRFKERSNALVMPILNLAERLSPKEGRGGSEAETPTTLATRQVQPPARGIQQYSEEIMTKVIQFAYAGARTLPGLLGTTVLVLVYMMFLLAEARRFPQRIRRSYPPERAEAILEVVEHINDGIFKYISIKVLASFLTAAFSLLIMRVFDLDFFVLWALLIFLFNFVPYIGSIVACMFPILTGLLQYPSPWTALWLAVFLTAVQLAVSQVIEPKMAGRRLGISPVVVLTAVAFWGWLWGVLGMVLAVPVVVAIKIIMSNVPATRPIAAMIGDISDEKRLAAEPPADQPPASGRPME